jgi:hypothetical protein
MAKQSLVTTDSKAFRNFRHSKMLSLDEISDAMRADGFDSVSKNTVWKVEAGQPVSIKTIKLLSSFTIRNLG